MSHDHLASAPRSVNDQRRLRLDVVVPVYNEAHVIASSVATLTTHLEQHLADYDWRVVIANNASTDATLERAQDLARSTPGVAVLHLDQKGRGRALRRAWLSSDADLLVYMDVDLSTDLGHLRPLVDGLAYGGCDLVIGNRLAREAATRRSLRRELISRCYNLIVRLMFASRIQDAQCGFKGITRHAARQLVPHVEDTQWFFDTELLLIAEHEGLRICQLPVRWVEDPDSRVRIVKTAIEDLRGLWRLRAGGLRRVHRALLAQREAAVV